MLENHKLACYLVFGCLVTGSISNGDIDSCDSDANDKKSQYDAGTSSLELGGRLALVTGAASGIGRSVAMGLARENVTVIVADINTTGGPETVSMLPSTYDHINFVREFWEWNVFLWFFFTPESEVIKSSKSHPVVCFFETTKPLIYMNKPSSSHCSTQGYLQTSE